MPASHIWLSVSTKVRCPLDDCTWPLKLMWFYLSFYFLPPCPFLISDCRLETRSHSDQCGSKRWILHDMADDNCIHKFPTYLQIIFRNWYDLRTKCMYFCRDVLIEEPIQDRICDCGGHSKKMEDWKQNHDRF